MAKYETIEQSGNIKLQYDDTTKKYKVVNGKKSKTFTLASLAVDEYFCLTEEF